MTRLGKLVVFTMAAAVAGLVGLNVTIIAQNRPAAGRIEGTVTADRGEVRALRVKATDTVNKISYTVFTNKGRYQIPNLPPGSYSVAIVEEEFEGPVQNVSTSRPPARRPRTSRSSTSRSIGTGRGRGRRRGAVELRCRRNLRRRDRDRAPRLRPLYPPSPARDVMVKECFTCHGPTGWHRSGPRSEAQWRRAVQRMFDADGRVAGMNVGVPQTTYDHVSERTGRADHQVPDRELRTRIQASRSQDGSVDQGRRGAQSGDLRAVRSGAADPCGVQADRDLRRSADSIAAFGLGQRRQSWRRLHVRQPIRVDRRRRHPRPRSGEADAANGGSTTPRT